MYLGRIISKRPIADLPEYIEVSDTFVDDGVPTLVVGKKVTAELFGPESMKVLDKRIRGEVYWTFSKFERRTDFEDDVKWFVDHTVQLADAGLQYYFVNIFTESVTFRPYFLIV